MYKQYLLTASSPFKFFVRKSSSLLITECSCKKFPEKYHPALNLTIHFKQLCYSLRRIEVYIKAYSHQAKVGTKRKRSQDKQKRSENKKQTSKKKFAFAGYEWGRK